jgi:hypothetical protein
MVKEQLKVQLPIKELKGRKRFKEEVETSSGSQPFQKILFIFPKESKV